MDEVVEFIRRFIEKAHEAERAAYLPDRAEFDARLRDADSSFDQTAGALGLNIAWGYKDDATDPEMADAGRQALARMRPAILFLVRRYAHPVFGDLYRAYIDSGTKKRQTSYLYNLSVARRPDGLKIIARQGKCLTCRGSGQLDGEACYQCGGTGWEDLGGEQLGDLGPAVEVRRLEAPTDPQSLADYQKD